MSSQSHSVIRDKRQQFANEIRRQKRNQIFKQKRKMLLQEQKKNYLVNNSVYMSNIQFSDLLKKLDQKQLELEVLNEIRSRLNSPNYNSNALIAKIIQSGAYCNLLQYLNNRQFIEESLSIFNIILSQQTLSYADLLFRKGLLQILFQFLNQGWQTVAIVANCVGNMCIEDQGFGQIILDTFKHELLINAFKRLHEEFLSNKTSQDPTKALQFIVWSLEQLCRVDSTTLDFTKQYDDILFFCQELLEQRLMLEKVIDVTYQLAVKNKDRVSEVVIPLVNELLEEETGQGKHLYDLFYLIYELSPSSQINYSLCWKQTLVGSTNLVRITLFILMNVPNESCIQTIIKDENWWQKLLIKVDQKYDEVHWALSVIKKFSLSFPCVWRFVSEYLNDIYNKETTRQILLFLRSILLQAAQEKCKLSLQSLIMILKTYKIPKILQKISGKENYELARNAEDVLLLMDRLCKEMKDKFDVQIQIET